MITRKENKFMVDNTYTAQTIGFIFEGELTLDKDNNTVTDCNITVKRASDSGLTANITVNERIEKRAISENQLYAKYEYSGDKNYFNDLHAIVFNTIFAEVKGYD
jgi:hypothetical protein